MLANKNKPRRLHKKTLVIDEISIRKLELADYVPKVGDSRLENGIKIEICNNVNQDFQIKLQFPPQNKNSQKPHKRYVNFVVYFSSV